LDSAAAIANTSNKECRFLQVFVNLDVIGNILGMFSIQLFHTDSWRLFFYSWLFNDYVIFPGDIRYAPVRLRMDRAVWH